MLLHNIQAINITLFATFTTLNIKHKMQNYLRLILTLKIFRLFDLHLCHTSKLLCMFHVSTDQCTHIINSTSFALRYSDMLQASWPSSRSTTDIFPQQDQQNI